MRHGFFFCLEQFAHSFSDRHKSSACGRARRRFPRFSRAQFEYLEPRRLLHGGVVASYSFDAGAGNLVADVSGHGHTGDITGAAWHSDGKFGAALSFDGIDDWVTIPDASALDLTTGMTLEAWLRPSNSSGWKCVAIKERAPGLAYALYANTPESVPAAYLKQSGATGDIAAAGAALLPPNVWSHLAATFDGTTFRLYVNGVQVNSQSASGSIVDSTEPLRIGGNAPWGEHYSGLIDELRIYSRALSPAEIQADMITPVGASDDTQPPAVSLTSPAAGANVSHVVQLVAAASDNVGIAGVEFFANGSSLGVDHDAPYTMSWNSTTLSSGTHAISVRATDTSGNLTTASPVDFNVVNPAFVNEVVVPGFTLATTLAFLPDGRMLVGELANKIWLVQPGASQPDPVPFLNLDSTYLYGEQGLMDIAIDPNFAQNGYIYVFYTKGDPNYDNHDRLSRFTVSGNQVVPGSEAVFWQDPGAGAGHLGGAIAFGPDGKIYFSVGEHFNPDLAQNLFYYLGKILRLNPDGTIPSDNPFHDGDGINKEEIWAYGLRNPFRMSFDSLTGKLYIADVGGNDHSVGFEEVNLGVAGANYGWPFVEGTSNLPGLTSPIFSYPQLDRDASITGGVVYRGAQFPAEFYGSYFFGDYAQNTIKRLTFDDSGNVEGVANFWPADGAPDTTLVGDPVKFLEGPDGSLYYVDIGFREQGVAGQASVRRIRYTIENQPPVAIASAQPVSGAPPLSVTFSSAQSSDPEGRPLTYSWTFGDGSSSAEPNPTHTYTTAGQYIARLTLSDGIASTISADLPITVGNRPTPSILTPLSGTLFRAGNTITFAGAASDLEDGQLPPSAFSWSIRFHHDGHVHPITGPITNTTTGAFTVPTTGHDFQGNTAYEIILTVTDSSGLTGVTSILVYPQKVNLTFDSLPSGLTLQIDGISRQTPFVLDDVIGFQHTINAPSQPGYQFASWSDSGAQSHLILTPSSNQSFLATFQPIAPSGPVAAYNFDAGSGTSLADATGNAHTGTITNANWVTAGKFGGALLFDGVDDLVTVAAAADLSFTTSMTLEAWVKPSASSGWDTIAFKERTGGSSYALYAGSPGGPPAGYLTRTGTTEAVSALGTAALPLDQWSHLATTYDGTTIRFYLGGVEVGSTLAPGAILTSTEPLRIGGNSLFDEFFAGLIDDLRIYDRALSAAEIQTDMNTPVVNQSVNHPPIAVDDSFSTPEDLPIILTQLQLTSNDDDVDDDDLTVTAVNGAVNGTVTLNPDGSIAFAPAAHFHGTAAFTYTLSDGLLEQTAHVTINVASVNDNPVASDDAATIAEDSVANLALLSNDSSGVDAPETLTVTSVSPAARGAVSLSPTGLTYTPNPNFFGTDTFTYAISDGNGGTAAAIVNITVTPVNDNPIAVDDTANVPENGVADIAVLTNDSSGVDASETLTITGVTQGARGTVTFSPAALTYTPNPNFFGADSFTYTIGDGNGGSATATVTLTVLQVDPVIAGNAGDDVFLIRLDSTGAIVEVFDNPAGSRAPIYTAPLATARRLSFDMLAGDDQLIVDLIHGNPLPLAGLALNGGANTAAGDQLVLLANGTATAAYAAHPSLVGAGSVLIDGRRIDIAGTEPIDASRFASFTVITPNPNDTLAIEILDTGVNKLSGVSGAASLSLVTVRQSSTLVIDAATNDQTSGDDSLSILSHSSSPASLALIEFLGGTGINALNIQGAASLVDATMASAATLATLVAEQAELHTHRLRQTSLTLRAGSRAVLLPNGGVSVLDDLELNIGATFDLTSNALIVRASATTNGQLHQELSGLIQSAQNGLDENFITNWNGQGITSSAARATSLAAGFDLVGLGLIRNSDLDITTGIPGSSYTSFGGQPVGPHDLLLKFTYTGDANLDGLVSFDDYVGIDNAFFGLIENLGWATGDINADGAINFDDYSVVDQAFFFQSAPLAFAGDPEALALGASEARRVSEGNGIAGAAGMVVRSSFESAMLESPVTESVRLRTIQTAHLPARIAASERAYESAAELAFPATDSLADARLSNSRRTPSRDLWDTALLEVLD